MSTLGDKLVQLSLDIDDKNKTIDLLRKLIEEQKGRHSAEADKFEKEMEESLKNAEAENDAALRCLFKSNESLSQKKAALESRVEELLAEKQNAENQKKANTESIRREFAEAKESAHRLHQQEKSAREKTWFDARVADIQKMTLKGIQPNIDRLVRKHREDCEEIRCKTQLSKQKLEVQCEEELMERIKVFQAEQQSNFSIVQSRNDFAHSLMREQDEHAVRMKKLRESLAEEEENTKKMYVMELQTLTKENEAAVSKLKSLSSLQHLEQNFKSKREHRRYELESVLEQVGRDLAMSKKEWEESWAEASKSRIEQQNEHKWKELLAWRESRVNELIRASIIEQAKLDADTESNSTVNETRMIAEHHEKLANLSHRLSSTQINNNELKAKISAAENLRQQLLSSLIQLEDKFVTARIKSDEATARNERKQKQHEEILSEDHRQLERSLESISRRKDEVKLEMDHIKEGIKVETREHNRLKSALCEEHEHQLDALEHHATESANEVDRKLLALTKLVKEKEVYLSKAQDLFSARYKKQ